MVICCKFEKNSSTSDNPRGQNLDININLMSLQSFATSLKKLFGLILYIFFMILYMYIGPGKGLTTLWGRNFYVNRNILSLWLFVASFKTSL